MTLAFRSVFDLRRDEWPRALSMGAYFFLVITSFWILKPLKKALFFEHYDVHGFAIGGRLLDAPSAELLAKMLNVLVAYLAVIGFSILARHHRRQQLTWAVCAFFLVGYAGYALLLHTPSTLTIWSFYLFGDLFSTLMVATFFAFLHDLAQQRAVAPDFATRSYGLIGLGGVLGGLFGSLCVATWIGQLPRPAWMGICASLAVCIAWVAQRVGRSIPTAQSIDAVTQPSRSIPTPRPHTAVEDPRSHPMVEGARLTVRSKYLLAIVAMVGIYEWVSSLLDYQFSATIAHHATGSAIGQHFAQTYLYANVVAFLVQLLLTGFVMRRLGNTIALSVLPATAMVASLGYFALPILPMAKLLNIADNGFGYSIQQSAKEALYVPRSLDEKYKAKAFIDMFVQRAAKALGILFTLALTMMIGDFGALRWLSLATVVLCLLWLYVARYAGRRFEALTETNRGATPDGKARAPRAAPFPAVRCEPRGAGAPR